ncbi:PAN domain-containing protein [Mesorhizobium sp.]|uniref:PAN domain-containing protein n=1 Tax=Mesorhizobium sp. TaxID=1871066 RepID=UPI00345CE9EC
MGVAGAVAAAVVSASDVQPANAKSTGELFDYPRTFLNGVVSAKVSIPLASCRELCSARSGCIGFDYASSDQLCRLFASVGSASQKPAIHRRHSQSGHGLPSASQSACRGSTDRGADPGSVGKGSEEAGKRHSAKDTQACAGSPREAET